MVTFTTDTPKSLYAAFRRGIKAGDITTWDELKPDHFTHTSTQWTKKASLEAIVDTDELRFRLADVKTVDKSYAEVYAFYHATMIRTFLDHFNDDFERATATAKPKK